MSKVITCLKCTSKFTSQIITEDKDFKALCPKCLINFATDENLSSMEMDDEESQPAQITDVKGKDSEILPSNTQLGQYRIIEVIGRGGMGIVYKAVDETLNRIVAIKLLPSELLQRKEFKERFIREAQITSKLTHPNIVPIYEINKVLLSIGQQQVEQYYIVMQYIEGASLETYLSTEGTDQRINLYQLLKIFKEVGRAVHFAHQHGIIHRDLKPTNIMITETKDDKGNITFTPYVTDFGLAKLICEQDKKITASGIIAGTPIYMSPEQVQGSLEIDGRSDVYSLGATLYELVTNKPPFRGKNSMDVVLKVINHEPVSPRRINPKIPKEIEIIIQKAMNKTSCNRYSSACEFADDIDRFLTHEPIRARPISLGYRLIKKIRKYPAIAVAILIVVLTILIGFVVINLQHKQAQQDINALEKLNSLWIKMVLTKGELYKGGGELLQIWKQLQERINEINLFINEQPLIAQGYYVRAQGKIYFQDYQGAEEDLKNALKLNPNLSHAWASLGRVYVEQFVLGLSGYSHPDRERRKQATKLLDKAVGAISQINNDSSQNALTKTDEEVVNETVIKAFRACFILSDVATAQKIIEDALEQVKSEEYYNWLGILSKESNQAIEYQTKAIQRMPFYAKAYYDRGIAKSKLGNYQDAINDFNQAIKINPQWTQVYLNWGMANVKLGNYQNGIDNCNQALQINPNCLEIYYYRGLIKTKLEDYQGAIYDYNYIIKLNHDYVDAYVDRGCAREKLSDFRGALDDYSHAIKIDPEDAKVYVNRAALRGNTGDSMGAYDDLTQAINVDPNYAKAYFSRGYVYYHLEQWTNAIVDWEKAIRLNQDFANELTPLLKETRGKIKR
ncbi:MAG: protein kinase [Planctomycetota bacterium]